MQNTGLLCYFCFTFDRMVQVVSIDFKCRWKLQWRDYPPHLHQTTWLGIVVSTAGEPVRMFAENVESQVPPRLTEWESVFALQESLMNNHIYKPVDSRCPGPMKDSTTSVPSAEADTLWADSACSLGKHGHARFLGWVLSNARSFTGENQMFFLKIFNGNGHNLP